MKIIFLLATAALLSSCRGNRSQEIVKVEYLHEYGVPVHEADWVRQGKNGQLVCLSSEDVTIKQNFEKGILHGETTYSFPHSSIIQKKEIYEQGVLIGRIEHYPTGVPMKEEKFENNKVIEVVTWYENGTPKSVEKFDNGFLIQGEYRNLDNEITHRVVQGHGIRPCYASTGDLTGKETFSNGELIEAIVCYPNMEPKSVTPYQNGLIQGTRLTFLPGGIPLTNEQWLHGIQEGITIEYLNGEKIAEIPYVKGKKDGVALYYRNGKDLVEKITWKYGMMHGPRILFIEEGAKKIQYYLEGEVVSRPTYERLSPLREKKHFR